ncbi:hypothetical protein GWC77_26915 [Paraburkholderia sp. NMBU_R16]|uniref:hypothetical protein n=1 Tax=Paraburkholderia sp. NMBU_R16 TaxID=2698676 RepID=UPI0015673E29|nr:hypothetical protein [Paraburkholderia sp. NMBU_R16]NRO99507.1 hypothetical protein [Paraburkholderia sp. NMBU_R16]
MIDYRKLGRMYGLQMSAAARQKALSERQETTLSGKTMVSIAVGGKASTKALVMTADQFNNFRKGFAA